MNELTGKVAVVTGASKGIGAGIAKGLAGAGASVVVNCASDLAGAEQVVQDVESAGGKAVAVKADIADVTDVNRLLDETISAFGQLDILVNNAGVFSVSKPFEEATEDEFHWMLNTNVLGPLLTIQKAIPHLAANGGGSIINIGSMVSQIYNPGLAIYTASKAALNGISGVLAVELADRNIRVNSILPGATDTEGTQRLGAMTEENRDMLISMTPLGRIGLPSDMAPIAVFLASDASAWVTGELIIASGGMR